MRKGERDIHTAWMRKREGDTHLLDAEVRNREIERERERWRERRLRELKLH